MISAALSVGAGWMGGGVDVGRRNVPTNGPGQLHCKLRRSLRSGSPVPVAFSLTFPYTPLGAAYSVIIIHFKPQRHQWTAESKLPLHKKRLTYLSPVCISFSDSARTIFSSSWVLLFGKRLHKNYRGMCGVIFVFCPLSHALLFSLFNGTQAS